MDDDQSMRDRMASADDGEARPPSGSPAPVSPASAESPVTTESPVGTESPVTTDPAADPGTEPAGDPAAGDPAAGRRAGRRPRSFWRELPVLVVVALVIALVIKTFVVQAFYIPSSSMEDTLLIGDKVLVNKVVYHFRSIQPGDVIVFNGAGSWDPKAPPAAVSSDPVVRAYQDTLAPVFRAIGGLFGTAPGQTDYIKRVIGVPGDRVACCNAQGLLTVNGVALHESKYLYPGAEPSQIRFSIKVPPGRLWVMGDNRLVSDDSRLHTSDPGHGTIPENMVIGRAFMIVWPTSRWRVVPIPSTFGQPGVTKTAAASPGVITTTAGPAPYLPLAGGFALALPMTWLQRRARLRRRRGGRRR
jgi:signal peptidase I